MNVLGYEQTSLIDVCKAINRKIGEGDPFSELIFVPSDPPDDCDDWIEGPSIMDGTIRLTFYAISGWSEDRLDTCLWLVHVHKATGHVFAIQVQGETQPERFPMVQSLAINVPALALSDLRDI